MAKVHHYGVLDRSSARSPEVMYEERLLRVLVIMTFKI